MILILIYSTKQILAAVIDGKTERGDQTNDDPFALGDATPPADWVCRCSSKR